MTGSWPGRTSPRPAGRPTQRQSPGRSRPSARSTRSATGSSTAARSTRTRCGSIARSWSASGRSPTWPRSTSRSRLPRSRRSRRSCPTCPPSPASTRRSTPACRPRASTYAIPPEWRKRWDLRKYGFHGLSHAYASRRAAEILGRPPAGLRIVTCHLGAGASLAAVLDGRSVDTTMGFTPLDGLVMATRSGSIDPGLVLWLEEHVRTPPAELAATLEHRSGLLGLAGTADMRAILAAAEAGDPDAVLALDVYHHRLRAAVAAMAAALGGLDVLVFTGGVGENAPGGPGARRARPRLPRCRGRSRAQRGRRRRPGDLERRARPRGRSSSPPARTSRSPTRFARCLEAESPPPRGDLSAPALRRPP